MGICSGKYTRTESRSSQTDLNPFFDFAKRDSAYARCQSYRPKSVHSRSAHQKPRPDTIYLNNSVVNDWKIPNRYDHNMIKSDNQQSDYCGQNLPEMAKYKFDFSKNNGDLTPTPSGVWPINGSGDYNLINLQKKKNNIQRFKAQLNRDLEKSKLNLNINFSDEDDNLTQRNNINNEVNTGFESKIHSQVPVSMVPEYRNRKINNRKIVSQKNNKMKSCKKISTRKIKFDNNNSNNYHSVGDDKVINSSSGVNGQKFHSSSLLDQDCYPIQYTFYVDDNDICTKPFYDRRMVAIAKTCRCRIYFHAKVSESEKPLYYKGKPVRPVTITSPDMACLKRCLGSIDSQFPYFNCKAFLSLSS